MMHCTATICDRIKGGSHTAILKEPLILSLQEVSESVKKVTVLETK
jgi:hypothetical protein